MEYSKSEYNPTLIKTEGTSTERGGNSKSATKVTLVDPNPGQEIIPHEDLFIYVNLKANTRPKSLLTQTSDKKYSISNLNGNTVSLSSPQNKSTTVNGDILFKTKPNLTTDWTEIGGFKSVFGETGNDYEGFGITNIDINIKSQVSPTVIIDFVDVRGATLFEQGSCSPYGFFFQLPYPVFELTVKGYYGKAATYYLNLVKFNTKFNSETGNMECRAEFIGYSFAFLSDIFMGYVMAASLLPNNYGFKDKLKEVYEKTDIFYEKNVAGNDYDKTYFCDTPNGCITVLQLLKELNSFEKVDKQKIIDSPEYQELVQLKEVTKLYNEYRNTVEEVVKTNTKGTLGLTNSTHPSVKGRKLTIIYGNSETGRKATETEISTGGSLANAFNTTGGSFLTSIKNILSTKIGNSYPYQLDVKAISCLCDPPSQFQDQSLTTYNIFNSSKIKDKSWYGPQNFWSNTQSVGSSVIYGYNPPKSYDSNPDQYFVDFGYILEDIYSEIEGLNLKISEKQKEVNEQIDRIIEDKLNFKPTIRNVFTILLSNTEAFMEVLKTVSIQAETYHSTESLGDLTNDGSTNKVEATGPKVYSWPTYSEQNTNPPSEEQKFPGNNLRFQNWPEVIFVEDFLKAFLQLQKEIDLLNANYEGKPGYDNFAPINPLESPAWFPNTPNKYLDLVGNQEIFKVIGERLFIALDHSVFQPIRLTKDALLIGQGTNNGIGKGEWNPLKNLEFVKNIAQLDSWNLLNSTTNEKQLQGLLSSYNDTNSFVNAVKKELTGLKELTGGDIVRTDVLGGVNQGFETTDKYYSYMADKDKGISIKKDDNDGPIWIHPNPFRMESSNLIKVIKQEDTTSVRGVNLTNEKFKTFLNNTYVTNLSASITGIDFKTSAFNPKLVYSVIDPNQQLVSFDKPQLYTTLAMCFDGSSDEDTWWTNKADVTTQDANSKGGHIVSNMGMITYWDDDTQNEVFGVTLLKAIGKDVAKTTFNTGVFPIDSTNKTLVGIKIAQVNFPIISTPMWLDNVIRFRTQWMSGSSATENYTPDTQFKNLAYLFLHTLKPTPFVQRMITDDGYFYYLSELGKIEPNGSNVNGSSLIWSHLAFNTIGGIAKVPKAWLLTLGAQLWRWREFTGTKKRGRWKKPLLCQGCSQNLSTDRPSGNDPLIQPGFNSLSSPISQTPTRNNLNVYLNLIYSGSNGNDFNVTIPKSSFGGNRQFVKELTDGTSAEINNGFLTNNDYLFFNPLSPFDSKKYGKISEIKSNFTQLQSEVPTQFYSWPQVYIAPHHIPYVLPDKFNDGDNGEGADFVFVTDNWIGYQDYQTIMPEKYNGLPYNETNPALSGVNYTRRSKQEDGNLGMIFQYIPDGIKDEIVQIFEDWALGEWKTNILPIVDPINFGNPSDNILTSYSYRSGDKSPAKMVSSTGTDDENLPDSKYVLSLNPNENLLRLLTDQYWILNSTPKIWYGYQNETNNNPTKSNQFYEDGFVVSETQFNTYLTSFYETYKLNLPTRLQELKDEKKDKSGNGSPIDDEDLKLSLYRSFKSLSEKWIQRTSNNDLFFNVGGTDGLTCKNGASKKSTLASHFTYVNRVWGDIGDKSYIDITKLNELKDNKKMSLYQLITDILSDNEYLFFALPSYINLTGQGMDDNDLKDMFRPILDISDSSCGPLFVSMYVGGVSRKLALQIGETNCKVDNDEVKEVLKNVNDDGFSLMDIDQPTDMASGNFTAFKVLYGIQNQNHFKNIQLDQSEFTETAESLNVIDKLAQNQGSDRTTKGQNLNSAYLTRSYTCTIESMGNMMIQPMTYFDLQGVPMFSGAYLITEVSHSVKPNNVSTTFKGVRQPRTIVPLVTSASIAMNLTFDENATGTGTGTSLRSITSGELSGFRGGVILSRVPKQPGGTGNKSAANTTISQVDTQTKLDGYGNTLGITDKTDDGTLFKLSQPNKPIGNIVNSAYANINVSTRTIPGTKGGNLGCAAAVSIIFYRATGYALLGESAITLGTSQVYDVLEEESGKNNSSWEKISDWETGCQAGDVICTARGNEAGHIGVVVLNNDIVSNSSEGFEGSQKGQIEKNYTIKGWNKVAKRNPDKTACFRYKGPYADSWGALTNAGLSTQDIYSKLNSSIKNPNLVYGIMGNIQAESGFNTNASGDKRTNTGLTNGSGKYYCSWGYTQLNVCGGGGINFLKEQKLENASDLEKIKALTNPNKHLDYTIKEVGKLYGGLPVTQQDTIENWTKKFAKDYERCKTCSDPNSEEVQKRIQFATQLSPQIS